MSAALITGAGRRIGRTLCIYLARQGYDIALHYRNSETDALQTAEKIRALGRRCELLRVDLENRTDLRGLVPKTVAIFPHLSVLINSASVFERSSLMETDESLFDRNLEIHLRVPFFLTQDFAAHCKQGHVINLLDTKISRNLTAFFAYTLSKKALAEFTRMAAKELAPGIRVNGISPGLILPSQSMTNAEFEKQGNQIPLKRTGNPDFIAQAVGFLLNHPFITGENLMIDGGEHLM